MKPLSGMWLYINLAFAIGWDFLGFILFIVGLTPGAPVSVAVSFIVDALAFMTDMIFSFLYHSYVQIYKVNLIRYQISRVKEMLRLSRSSQGNKPNPVSNALANKTQKIGKYMASTFSDYVVNFAIIRIRNTIVVSTVELVPWLGDFSPSWTIKAWNHIGEHRKIARRLKAKIIEFENSLAKWRGSLRAGGKGRFASRNPIPRNKSTQSSKIASNNIRPLTRKTQQDSQVSPSLASNNIRPVTRTPQLGVSSVSNSGPANNIRPFTRLPKPGASSVPADGVANNIRPSTNTPQLEPSSATSDVPANNIRPFTRIPKQGESSVPTDGPANNIRPFTRRTQQSGQVSSNKSSRDIKSPAIPVPQISTNVDLEDREEKLEELKAYSRGVAMNTDIVQNIINNIESNNKQMEANNIRTFQRQSSDSSSQPTQAQNKNNLNNTKPVSNNIQPFNRQSVSSNSKPVKNVGK